jgi:hypothetical protein
MAKGEKFMKKILVATILLLFWTGSAWGLNQKITVDSVKADDDSFRRQEKIFLQSIPSIADQFIGIPYELGGNPQISGTSDNSYLFFSIYTLAAQKAGLYYSGYLPMSYLLGNTREVDKNDLQNGDLIVLENNHAAMIYWIDESGKMYFLYASEKRQKIIAFNSENPVFDMYWLENIKGFYRISDTLLSPLP